MTVLAILLRITAAVIALIAVPALPGARAQGASAWKTESHAAARLISGAPAKLTNSAERRAGLEIRLDPGWETYWRYPGDSGTPPTFDFAGSENVKAVTVRWPAPERFADGAGGHSIGYRGDVVLPLHVTAEDAAKPSLLHVKFGYAICGTLCVPAEAELDLLLSGKGGSGGPALAAAEARVPRRVPLGSGGALAVRSVHRDKNGERVVVEVAAAEGTPVDLFVEGPAPDWALPLPESSEPAASHSQGLRRFVFKLDGLPPGADAEGATFTFTAVSPDDAIEVSTHLD